MDHDHGGNDQHEYDDSMRPLLAPRADLPIKLARCQHRQQGLRMLQPLLPVCWHLASMIGGSARGRGRVRWVFVRLLVVAPMVVVHGAFSRARQQRAAQRPREAWKPSFPREFDTAR